jgi:hypothetical protein
MDRRRFHAGAIAHGFHSAIIRCGAETSRGGAGLWAQIARHLSKTCGDLPVHARRVSLHFPQKKLAGRVRLNSLPLSL